MEVTLKVRFNSSRERLERFAPHKYVLYAAFEEDSEAELLIRKILSSSLGAPVSDVNFKTRNPITKDWVFVIG